MKGKRIFVSGLSCVFLTSTMVARASAYNETGNTVIKTVIKEEVQSVVSEENFVDENNLKELMEEEKVKEEAKKDTATENAGLAAKSSLSDAWQSTVNDTNYAESESAAVPIKATPDTARESDALSIKAISDTAGKESDKTELNEKDFDKTELNEKDFDKNDFHKSDFYIEGDVLIKYEGTDEYVRVPDGVKIIGKEAFKGNPYVRELILSDSVKCAESEAFAYMENLEMIEKGAFFYTEYDDIYDGSDKLSKFNVRGNL